MKAYEAFISKNDVLKIHENVVRILSNVGVIFENQKALDIFKNHGAKVENNKVFINRQMLEDSIKLAPQKFTVHSSVKGDVSLGGGSMLTGGLISNIYIEDNGSIRKMDNGDVMNQFKMNETSSVTNYAVMNVLMDYSGCSKDQKAFATMAITLKYSQKYHISSGVTTIGMNHKDVYDSVKKGIGIVKKFEGLDDKVVLIETINPLSPLAYDSDPLDKLMASCDEGQAMWLTPCSMPLLTAPASVAGLVSTTTAEVLAGLVLAQLINPGTPVIFGNTSASTNMKNIQLSIGAPETALINYATAAMADYYELPFRTGGALCDAKDLDAQAGAESMMMLYSTLSCRPDYILHTCGTMGTFNVLSLEKYLVDEEIFGMVHRQLKGIDCSDEKLCYNEIEKVGARGNFLRGRTPKMFREEFYTPTLFNKEDPNQWQKDGAKSIKEVAKRKVHERLLSFNPPKLTKDQNELLRDYIPVQYRNGI